MPEKIAVVFEKLGSVAGKSFYHESLVYTDASGKKSIATAFATKIPPGSISGLSKAASAANAGAESDYGVLKTQVAPASSLSKAEQEHWMGSSEHPYPETVVASGDDLSQQWRKVEQAYQQIGQNKLPYSPLTQNSNSTATSAMKAAGIKPPAGTGIAGQHWSPAADTPVPVDISVDAPSVSGGGGTGGGPLQVIDALNMIICTGCPIPHPLKVTMNQTVFASKMLCATIADAIPIVNILPFGPCALTPLPPSPSGGPCIPKPVGPWQPGSALTSIQHIPSLRQTDTLQCATGGTITVMQPGQAQVFVK